MTRKLLYNIYVYLEEKQSAVITGYSGLGNVIVIPEILGGYTVITNTDALFLFKNVLEGMPMAEQDVIHANIKKGVMPEK